MQFIQVAAGVLNQTPLDWDRNQANVLAAMRAAKAGGVAILCLPELCITGYGCEDAFQSPGVHRLAWQVLEELLPESAGMIVSVGLPIMHNNALFNAAALLVDGRLAGFVSKRFLAGDGIHYEPRWFKPWPTGYRDVVRHGGREYPIGDLYFDCGGVRIGFEICEDAWVANRPGSEMALRGVDVILNPSASHFAFGKTEIRRRFVLEGSRAFGVSYVYSNLQGNEAGRAIYDGDAMIASDGRLLAFGPRFSMDDWHLVTAVVDVDLTRMNRARTASFKPVFAREPHECVTAPFAYPAVSPSTLATPPHKFADGAWETGPHLKEEEFARAVPLALFDYLRKSRSHGFVVSLSGGADSSAVSCLVAMMVEMGVAQLGLDGFKQRLAYIDRIKDARDVRSLVSGLLACVYQSTRNSTETTLSAARGLAEDLGAEFLVFDVDAQVQRYIQMVSEGIGRPLTWEKHDLALQNIQARARAPSVWLLANVRKALLLSTSNRSEAAVGYATMDGDTSGGLCPIAGIDKAFLRRWLVWLETTGGEGGRPVPALAAVNRQLPTAELRPPESHQTDEDDLMPYDVLDAIERAAIRDKRTPLEVFQLLQPQFSCSAQQLAVWVERFFTLWCRNQWKRERYAPSFHLDDENLDPKTWCRFPILSGGYVRELKELREHVRRLG
ncbi:MAG: NAD(+) synthase [Planctomycetia bacterium]|nr:NAD(+) synthase [Planctomycetia bacterium]